jgi:hypothetical protein
MKGSSNFPEFNDRRKEKMGIQKARENREKT